MSEVKHTPGPWYADEGTDGAFDICVDKNARGRFMVICSGSGHSHFPEETRANGRLIAAAPDMLQGLRDARALLVHAGSPIEWLDAIIAKATPENQTSALLGAA
jgi:hypothetical protein